MTRVTRIHQIEMTSRCNLKCRYCIHPKMARPKMDMDVDVYEASLGAASEAVKKNGQDELNIVGVGESTMHPMFVEWVKMAREAIGWETRLVITTNGILIDREMAKSLAFWSPDVFVSAHRPEKAGPAIEYLKAEGILAGVSLDPTVAAIDWAGQVDWHVSAPSGRECMWLRDGRVMILADGSIATCCLTGDNKGVVGNIMQDDPFDLEIKPYELCESCDQEWRHLP